MIGRVERGSGQEAAAARLQRLTGPVVVLAGAVWEGYGPPSLIICAALKVPCRAAVCKRTSGAPYIDVNLWPPQTGRTGLVIELVPESWTL